MNIWNRVTAVLFNRSPEPSVQVSIAAPATIDPTDKLGDPIASLKPQTVDVEYRRRINRGELALPTWALHEALRVCPMLGNYARLWTDSLGRLDWTIKTSDDTDALDAAKRQAETLRTAYEKLDVMRAVQHLARATLYGYSVLVRETLEPINWWNMARAGLYGEWRYNPTLRVSDGQHERLGAISSGQFVIHEVEHNCLLEYLRIFVQASQIESYWDGNLEKESRRQVVVIPGQLNGSDVEAFKNAAVDIMLGRSGTIAGGIGDKQTEVLFPPESRGLPYYENRLKLLDEWACKCLFGAPLIANTAPDSGTLAGNAHTQTAETRIGGAAASISATMQEQFDRRVLEAAGLLQPGERALSYFQLAPEAQADPSAEVEWTVKLAAAGWRRDAAELSERTGMTLVPADAVAAPTVTTVSAPTPQADLSNRAAAELGVPDAWLSPVRALINGIAAKVPDTITPDYLQSVLDELRNSIPEVFDRMDIAAFAGVLERSMGEAALEGVRDAVGKVATAKG